MLWDSLCFLIVKKLLILYVFCLFRGQKRHLATVSVIKYEAETKCMTQAQKLYKSIAIFHFFQIGTVGTIEPGNNKLFEKQQKVYYHQVFAIEEVVYAINWLKSSHKKFTIPPLSTLEWFTIARFDFIWICDYLNCH